MIVNGTVLKEKFQESDSKAYDYLIDNAENDKESNAVLKLQEMNEKLSENDEKYIKRRREVLSKVISNEADIISGILDL